MNIPQVKYRKSFLALANEELEAVREAFRKVYQISDDRGYQYHASIHGGPPRKYCPHGNLLFLPWHRAYLYFFELALQDQVPGVTLPYWDWSTVETAQTGVPPVFTAEFYQRDGEQTPNPLFKARVAHQNRDTRRNPREPAAFASLRTLVLLAQGEQRFDLYSRAAENPHNGLHGRMRGDMASQEFAAFDPIFWAHHSNVDRLWAEWQRAHPEALVPFLEEALDPFPLTVAQTLDTRALGYDYSGSGEPPPLEDNLMDAEATTRIFLVRKPVSMADEEGPVKANLELHGVNPTEKSYEVRFFINKPDADANTPLDDPHFAGQYFLFGHGPCIGEEGHCSSNRPPRHAFDFRRPHHLTPFDTFVDVSQPLENLSARGEGLADESDELEVVMVVLDEDGNQVSPDVVNLEGLVLTPKK
jgi:tyrosinase